MKIVFNPRKQFPGRGPCIELVGQWVTPEVHDVVQSLLANNWMDSLIYKARTKAHAFFQGGSDKRDGQWILLEFWTTEAECQDFVDILNREVNKVIDPNLTEFHFFAKSMNDIAEFNTLMEMVAEDVGLPLITGSEAESHKCRAILKPEDSVTHRAVHIHANYTFGIKHHIYSKV